MDVKAGYKLTDVGVIPEDWDSATVFEIASSSRNAIVGGPFGSDLVATDYVDIGVPVIRGQNMGAKFLSGKFVFVSSLKADSLEANIARPDDLVFTQRGTLGQVSLVPKTPYERYLVSQSQMKVSVNQKLIKPEFLYYLFCGAIHQKIIQQSTIQTSLPHINLSILKNISVLKPPIHEQEAIAGALSDADALIESLEQLIAKKRQIKQAAMQELLSPKNGWMSFAVGDIADSQMPWSFTGGPFGSNLKASDYTTEGVRIIQLQNIGDGEFINDYAVFTSPTKADELMSCNIYPGEIILSKMGDPVARACIVPAFDRRYLMCSDGIRLSVDCEKFNTAFVHMMLNSPNFRAKAANAGTGSTRKRIGLTELRNLILTCPDIDEQNRIAGVLSDMDAEIAALDDKLNKARQIKQGMMQELLTGRIRLNVETQNV